MAVIQVEMSKNSSRGWASKSAAARNPPMRAPATPINMVTMMPPGSSPGSMAFAMIPAEQAEDEECDDAHAGLRILGALRWERARCAGLCAG